MASCLLPPLHVSAAKCDLKHHTSSSSDGGSSGSSNASTFWLFLLWFATLAV
jgi:hypothetical protein